MAIQKINFKFVLDLLKENSKPMLMVLSFIGVMICLFFAHKMWVIKRERAAQYDFAFLMTEYDKMLRDKNPEWSELLEKFEKNYNKHSNSSLLPYYLNYKVQILLAQDKKDEALVVLGKMIANMPASPILPLYQMERALIQLDSNNIELRALALKELENLAHDAHNVFRDSAQYYVGSYYWAQNDIESAREVWQKLVDEQRDEQIASSPWVDHVQAKLALTII